MLINNLFYSHSTEASLLDDGYWKVVSTIKQANVVDGKPLTPRYIDTMSIDKDLGRAFSTALKALELKFESVGKDLYGDSAKPEDYKEESTNG